MALCFPAFFPTVDRDWAYFNGLSRDTRQIEQWQGIVFCGLRGQVENADVDYLRDDRYLIAGHVGVFISGVSGGPPLHGDRHLRR
jgi:hypothetical protein